MGPVSEIALDELFGIVDGADSRQRVHAKVRTDEQRLRIGIRDAPNARATMEVRKVGFEARAEGGVFNRVDLALETAVLVVVDETSPFRPEVRVVIHPEKHVVDHVPFGRRAKETAHCTTLR